MDQVVLRLDGECIEAAARRELRRLIGSALASPVAPDGDTAHRIELLGDFVRQTDFRALRAARSELAGGRDLEAIVRRVQGPGYEVEVLPRVGDPQAAGDKRGRRGS